MSWSQRSLHWNVGGLLLLCLSAGACWHKGNGQDSVASSPKAQVSADSAPAPSQGVNADVASNTMPVAIAEAASAPGSSKPNAEQAAGAETASAPVANGAPPTAASGSNAWAIPARDALLRASCARCHNGSLPTSVPAALAIYNLVEDPWYGRLETGHYEGILRRVTGSSSFPEADKTAIVNFVHCARDGACEPAPSTDSSPAKPSG